MYFEFDSVNGEKITIANPSETKALFTLLPEIDNKLSKLSLQPFLRPDIIQDQLRQSINSKLADISQYAPVNHDVNVEINNAPISITGVMPNDIVKTLDDKIKKNDEENFRKMGNYFKGIGAVGKFRPQ